MALQKSKERPEGSVYLSEEEALNYQWDHVKKSTRREIWPFTHGLGALSACAGFTSLYINNHFRVKFKLMDFGRLATYIPNAVLPMAFLATFHHVYVSNDVLIRKTDCSICVQMKAVALQVGFGVLYPSILVPLSTSLVTKHYGSYRLPQLHKEPMEVLRLYVKLYRPIKQSLVNFAIFHAVAATLITYLEMRSAWNLGEKLLKQKAEEDKESDDEFVT